MYRRPVPSWAIQCSLPDFRQSGLSVVPNINLVSNIGFGEQATSTKNKNALSELAWVRLRKIVHPSFAVPLREVDARLFQTRVCAKEAGAGCPRAFAAAPAPAESRWFSEIDVSLNRITLLATARPLIVPRLGREG